MRQTLQVQRSNQLKYVTLVSWDNLKNVFLEFGFSDRSKIPYSWYNGSQESYVAIKSHCISIPVRHAVEQVIKQVLKILGYSVVGKVIDEEDNIAIGCNRLAVECFGVNAGNYHMVAGELSLFTSRLGIPFEVETEV